MDYPFYVNNFDRVRNYAEQYPLVTKIFEHPVAFWYGQRNGKPIKHLEKSLARLFRRTLPALPVFVLYNLPNRDMGHYSKGGASSAASYLEFIESFALGVGELAPIVIFEPDALPHSTEMEPAEAQWRYELMRETLTILTERTNAIVYVDVGHSNWLSPEEAGKLLNSVCVPGVRGFSVNVSNFRTTQESVSWAERVGEYTSYNYFVVDTSRNGNGPYGNEWCNPPGRAIGLQPTTDTDHPLCDAYLWIKIPGESDGRKNNGPRAGRFWPEYAEQLLKNCVRLNS
jgi:endoglucanase